MCTLQTEDIYKDQTIYFDHTQITTNKKKYMLGKRIHKQTGGKEDTVEGQKKKTRNMKA